MTSGFFGCSSGAREPLPSVAVSDLGVGGFDTGGEVGSASRAGVFKSFVDFDGAGISERRFISVPGVGGDAKSLYELSVILGIFHGNLLKDIQQKMIARDQMSVGCGSYFLSS